MSGSTNLSFKFSKTVRKQLNIAQNSNDSARTKEIIQNVEEEEEESESKISSEPVLISGFDAKGFNEVDGGTKEEKKELVIPALKNTLQLHGPAPGDNDEDAIAKRALLEDAQRLSDNVKDQIRDSSSIPIQLHKDEKVDLSKISAEDADYDFVSVDVFGKALLRGMGWKEGQAIGRSGKAVAPVITAPRPKGLGLGAEIKPPPGTTASSSKQRNGDAEEALVLKIGAYVKRVDAKSDKDRYGKVISWDEDNARVVVQLAIGRTTMRVSQHVVRVVTYKEYEKAGKCINQSAYEEYKDVEEKKLGKRRGQETSDHQDIVVVEKKKEDGRRDESKDSSRRRREKEEHSKSSRDDDHWKESSSKYRNRDRSRTPIKPTPKSWLRPDIRVRVVDDKYRRGKFFKTKAVVLDVKAAGVCSCMAEDGKTLLDDLKEDMLETVVPRKNGAAVVIVRGSNAGKIGTILERDSRSCLAAVQLANAVKNVPFDDICEYVGEMPDD